MARRSLFRRRGDFGVLLLLIQLFQFGFDKIPPVTLGVVAINVSVYLGIFNEFLGISFPNAFSVCAGIKQVWMHQEWWRLVAATFHHGDDMHLYYNMISFLMKSITLEKRYGSHKLASLLAVFSVLTNIVMLYLNYAAYWFFRDSYYLSSCAIGFSGVVFAVKVLTTHLLPHGRVLIMGFIPVPSKYSCWAELILIHILVPNASFNGHLAGIIVGYAYTRGPLRYVMDTLLPSFVSGGSRPSYTYVSGTISSERPTFNDRRETDDEEQEQFEQAVRNSLNEQYHTADGSVNNETSQQQPPAYGWNVDNSDNNEARPNNAADGSEMRRRWMNYSS